MKINSFMSWIGGKKALRDEIVNRFPLEYDRYIEVFGGGGWVLFHKKPEAFEVYNDFNQDLVNLYHCVKEKPQELIDFLTFVLNSRADFEYAKKMMKSKCERGDVKRAAYYYTIIRYSYASGCKSYSGQPHSMWRNFPLISATSDRLQTVSLDNRDFEKVICTFDRPKAFMYADPPYYKAELYDVEFRPEDHLRLANALLNMQGLFLLSYNDRPEIREMYNKKGIWIESLSRLNNLTQRYNSGEEYPELLISNYDTTQLFRKKAQTETQLTLFGEMPDYEKILRERKITLCKP